MPNFPSFNDLFRIFRDTVLTINAQISRDAVEREGMDANILAAGSSAMGDEVVGQAADLMTAIFLASAVGNDLDNLVFDRFGLTRKPAAVSVGSVSFTTLTNSPSTFPIASGVIVQAADGTQFVTSESGIFEVGTKGPVVLAVRSVLAGPNENVQPNTITSIISQIPSSPNNLKVTNPFATVGADAAETDDAFRSRAQGFFTTARRGTLSALEQAALGIAGVRSASAIEVLDALGRPAKVVQLVVTDAFTEQFINYTTVPPLFPIESQALSETIQAALEDVRPAGTFVQVVIANIILQPIQLTLSFQAGTSVNSAALQARAAAVNYVNSLEPGAPLRVADLQAAVALTPGLVITGNEIASPPGDIIAKPLQVIRTALGMVAAVAAQTNTPIITGANPDAFVIAGS